MTMIISGSDGLEFPDGSDQGTAFTGNAATITSGTIATARLATGTANSSTYLRGDQTWAAVPAATPGGSNTYVQYNNAGTFGGDSGFVYDASSNVGIGTASPTARLDVRRSTTDGVIAELHQSSGYGIDIGSSESVAYVSSGYLQALTFKTDPSSGQTERMRIDSSGNVGIGTTPSASANTDCKQIALGGLTYISSTNGTSGKQNFYTGLCYNAYQSGQSTFNAIVSNSGGDYLPSAYIQFQGLHRWLTASSATAGSAISFTTAMEVDDSLNLKFNSGYGSAAVAYGCRAWVNFNGTGTIAIRSSGNVSSISDGGTGNYTVNFTTAMPDANYSVGQSIQADVTNSNRNLTIKGGTTPTTSGVSLVVTGTASTTTYDVPIVNIQIFR